ncbi:DUF6894 family protein [Methylobacterium iners]|uniref:DUF6894 domain-containing protein n=1 Tax=Methylobacterium iners TaxID=418707 RepID=A0ABQ4RYE3_9HYPH|nr:hypothetical protein [Methylobacterium iners]GJD95410.1 hypothetical protein OCOJLMKI_2622 [Methylobacterium iners]
MPRYFFNTRIEGDFIKDEGGAELRDPEQAWEVARDTAHAMLQDPATQTTLLAASLVVTDEAGEVVLEFPFAEALTPPPEGIKTVH